MLSRLQPMTRAHQAAALVLEWIRSGVLRPGEQLPSERRLAEQIGVSRTVLRGALAELQAQGLLAVRRGRGHFVAEADFRPLQAPWHRSVQALEALAGLAVAAVPLILAGGAPDLSELRQVVQRIQGHQRKGYLTTLITCTCDFHVALVHLAGSPRLAECAGAAAESVRAGLSEIREHLTSQQGDRICHAQSLMLQALAAPDPHLAVDAACDLVQVLRSLWLTSNRA